MRSDRDGFYDRKIADRLIDPSCFTHDIDLYLDAERNILNSVVRHYDTLVEVGSMHGRHLEWAVETGKRYIGVDLIERYIRMGNKRINRLGLDGKKFKFVNGPAEQLHVILSELKLQKTSRALLFFPFNSIGNMNALTPVAEAICKSACPFLVGTYHTGPEATAARELYYRRCGYHNIGQYHDERGVWFISSDGLRTIAYHTAHFVKVFAEQHLNVLSVGLSKIGVAYLSDQCGPSTDLWRSQK